MASVDLNLLVVLDALLQEGSVAGAARRLSLTPSAVSRSLRRLRSTVGDELLVRVGRDLVPTPAAQALRGPAHEAVQAAIAVLAPVRRPTDAEVEHTLSRTFVIRTGPDNASGFGPAVLEAMRSRAPGARLRFTLDDDRALHDLRDGLIDLVLGSPVPGQADAVHRETLMTDRVVVVARGDGALAQACHDRGPTLDELADQRHVVREPPSVWQAVLDAQLAERDLVREVVATAPGFAASFALVRSHDLVCLAPEALTRMMLGPELRTWPSPSSLPGLTIEQAWHRRSHADPEHRWLRGRVREAVGSVASS